MRLAARDDAIPKPRIASQDSDIYMFQEFQDLSLSTHFPMRLIDNCTFQRVENEKLDYPTSSDEGHTIPCSQPCEPVCGLALV